MNGAARIRRSAVKARAFLLGGAMCLGMLACESATSAEARAQARILETWDRFFSLEGFVARSDFPGTGLQLTPRSRAGSQAPLDAVSDAGPNQSTNWVFVAWPSGASRFTHNVSLGMPGWRTEPWIAVTRIEAADMDLLESVRRQLLDLTKEAGTRVVLGGEPSCGGLPTLWVQGEDDGPATEIVLGMGPSQSPYLDLAAQALQVISKHHPEAVFNGMPSSSR